MPKKRSSKPPEKLTAKVAFSLAMQMLPVVLVTLIAPIVHPLSDDKDHLQKVKAKVIKEEKVARAHTVHTGISKVSCTETQRKDTEKLKQTDNSAVKRKLAVNQLLEENVDEDTEDEDQYEASYRRYLERTRESSKKKKASQKKAVNNAKHYRQMAAHLSTAEPQGKRLKASQLESDDDDVDVGEVPFVGEDLALNNMERMERENRELKKLIRELKGKKVTKEVPTTVVHVDVDKTITDQPSAYVDTDKRAEPGEYGDINVARKLNLVPLVPGSNVFLSPSKLATAGNGVSSPTILTYNLLRVFFKKEIIMISNYKGGGTAGYKALNPTITNAIIGYVKIKMSQIKTSLITQAINTYCTRIRNQLKIKEEPQEG
ncbi:hypothetical protein AC249_AIPGENE27002 [Exaiptasia diaphana]|nr:hypothetical protein AC249_AIPGENE27002 [Exaiptasia diaphana]